MKTSRTVLSAVLFTVLSVAYAVATPAPDG